MANSELEKRLTALEEEVVQLKALIHSSSQKKPWWDIIYGAFEGDPYFKKAMEYGRKYRESLRPKPRKKVKRKNQNGDT